MNPDSVAEVLFAKRMMGLLTMFSPCSCRKVFPGEERTG